MFEIAILSKPDLQMKVNNLKMLEKITDLE